MPEGITQLGQYGLVGVMLALIGLVIVVVWVNYKISGNHINHSTKALEKNTDAISEVREVLAGLKTLIKERLK